MPSAARLLPHGSRLSPYGCRLQPCAFRFASYATCLTLFLHALDFTPCALRLTPQVITPTAYRLKTFYMPYALRLTPRVLSLTSTAICFTPALYVDLTSCALHFTLLLASTRFCQRRVNCETLFDPLVVRSRSAEPTRGTLKTAARKFAVAAP